MILCGTPRIAQIWIVFKVDVPYFQSRCSILSAVLPGSRTNRDLSDDTSGVAFRELLYIFTAKSVSSLKTDKICQAKAQRVS